MDGQRDGLYGGCREGRLSFVKGLVVGLELLGSDGAFRGEGSGVK